MREEIIFTKYASNRKEKFKVATQIFKKNDIDFGVRKIPMCESAKPYLRNIYNSYLKLKPLYETETIFINQAILQKDYIEFEYINGQSLEDLLDKHLKEGDMDGFIDLLQQYYQYIKKISVRKTFQNTEEFIQIFGLCTIKEMDIIPVPANIDLIFSNIIVSNNIWTIIDYEWTFSFEIPMEYVLFRSMYVYLSENSQLRTAAKEVIKETFKLTGKSMTEYEFFEQNFQRYIYDEKELFMKNNLQKNRYNFNEILVGQKTQEFQIFFDFGYGFNEANSYILKQTAKNIYHLVISIPEKTQKIRIDPGNDVCFVQIFHSFFYDSSNSKYASYTTNGITIDNGQIIYLHNDPQIIINTEENFNMELLIVDCSVNMVDKSLLFTVTNMFQKLGQIETDRLDMQNVNRELNQDNQQLTDKYNKLLEKQKKDFMQINELSDKCIILEDKIKILSYEKEYIKNESQIYKEKIETVKNSPLGKIFFHKI